MKIKVLLIDARPDLIQDWDYEKNKDIDLNKIKNNSSKEVWWKCHNNPEEHVWKTKVKNRSNGKGLCPFCLGRKVCLSNSLYSVNPKLSLEWHPTKNGSMTPKDYTVGSNEKVWWLCSKGHAYEATIKSRHGNNKVKGTNCPYCQNLKVCSDNSLHYTHPHIAKEWHPTKNRNLTPHDVTAGTDKKAWFICLNNEEHEYEAYIKKKALNNSGCPYCNNRLVDETNCLSTTHPEIAKLWNIEKNSLTPQEVTFGSHKEIYWNCEYGHIYKKQVCEMVRFSGINPCSECNGGNSTSFPEQAFYYYLNKIFSKVKNRHQIFIFKEKYEVDIFIEDLNIGLEYDSELHDYSKIERDEEKNKLLPLDLIRIRDKKCPDINAYNSIIFNYKVTKQNIFLNEIIDKVIKYIKNTYKLNKEQLENIKKLNVNIERDRFLIYENYLWDKEQGSLQYTHPEISKQWHETENGNITPKQVSYGSDLKAVWQCEKDLNHIWSATVSSRTISESGCPYCSGVKVLKEDSFGTNYPSLLKEWDWNKNKQNPFDLVSNSVIEVYWKNSNGDCWKERISKRVKESKLESLT